MTIVDLDVIVVALVCSPFITVYLFGWMERHHVPDQSGWYPVLAVCFFVMPIFILFIGFLVGMAEGTTPAFFAHFFRLGG